jgi:hypothetical protein
MLAPGCFVNAAGLNNGDEQPDGDDIKLLHIIV